MRNRTEFKRVFDGLEFLLHDVYRTSLLARGIVAWCRQQKWKARCLKLMVDGKVMYAVYIHKTINPYTITSRIGWLNRHLDGLPKTACMIEVMLEFDGTDIFSQMDFSDTVRMSFRPAGNVMSNGHFGTAVYTEGEHAGKEIVLLSKKDDGFVYYKLIS